MYSTFYFQQFFGERQRSSSVGAVSDDYSQQNRLFIVDQNSKLNFLIDTDADVSVLPKQYVKNCKESVDFKLYAANGSIINTYGEHLCLNFGLRRPYKWKFIIAIVPKPIIVADFLKPHGLLVDLRSK